MEWTVKWLVVVMHVVSSCTARGATAKFSGVHTYLACLAPFLSRFEVGNCREYDAVRQQVPLSAALVALSQFEAPSPNPGGICAQFGVGRPSLIPKFARQGWWEQDRALTIRTFDGGSARESESNRWVSDSSG